MEEKKNKINKTKISVVLGIMCFALALGICIQIRTVKNSNSTVSSNYEENNLRAEVLKYKEKYDNKRLEIIINEMLIEAQALGINGVLKTNNFEISSGETANIYEIIFETIMKFRETNFILYIQVNNSYTEIKYLFDGKYKNFKKEIEKLQLEKLLKIEQIIDEDGTTIKLKILRGEN